MKQFILILLLLFFCSRCQFDPTVQKPLVFYVIGDWGRMGNPNQMVLAYQMSLLAKKEAPQFIISTGDNFYDEGVDSIDDRHWKKSFEDVYVGNLRHVPWYVVLGNHDYYGNPDLEIAYSKISTRWNMPERYYTKVFPLNDNTHIRFLFADTSPFEKSYYSSTSLREKLLKTDTLKQKQWLDSLTSPNDNNWEIVIGHHHVYSGGARRNEYNSVKTSLEPIFIKNKVDAYFCGHEHDLQHLKAIGKPTQYFVSGAGSDLRPTDHIAETLFSASIQGFLYVRVSSGELTANFIDYKGNVIYSTKVEK